MEQSDAINKQFAPPETPLAFYDAQIVLNHVHNNRMVF